MVEVGNTKQPLQYKNHFFTWNNYPSDAKEILETKFKSLKCDYVFQEEKGEQGTPHIQGCLFLTKRLRWSQFNLPKEMHWEKTRNAKSAIDYCCKIDTRNGEVRTNIVLPEPIDCIDKENLYEWQRDICELITKKPDPRHIYFIIDKEGGKGKSELCRYLCLKEGAILLGGKAGDMKYGIMKYEEKNKRYPRTILIDLPRTFDSDFLCYQGIEEIKNGMFFNTKYESNMVIFNRPHIFIFSNKKPCMDKLTTDRWIIQDI